MLNKNSTCLASMVEGGRLLEGLNWGFPVLLLVWCGERCKLR